jgi:EAL domain-containing protein (putative c-di-GMP-specific phosphodiesterase class I)
VISDAPAARSFAAKSITRLAALGSDEAQGYFFSKPMKLEAITRLIA